MRSSSGSGGSKKRSRPSGGPKTHIPSDFAKRPKAKVGKRAKKAANVTDTQFRAASVQVRNQDGVGREGSATIVGGEAGSKGGTGGLELISSRGKSLPLLLSTLSHHSSVVRLSSLNGIKDAISSSRSSSAAVRANLSSLVPALGRCCVDDDDEVRNTGRELLREVALRIGDEDSKEVGNNASIAADGSSTSTISRNAETAARHLSSYRPLLVAYVTSALNSLDVSIRLDGAKSVETLIQTLGMESVGRHAKELLPGFARVMVDAKTRGSASGMSRSKPQQKHSGNKNDDSWQNVRSAVVLRSLVLLLRAAASAAHSVSSDDEFNGRNGVSDSREYCTSSLPLSLDLAPSLSPPDLVFVKGGSATNAVLAYRNCYAPHPNGALLSLGALATASRSAVPKTSTDPTTTTGLSVPIQVELYSRLRDRLVELSQAGHVVGGGGRGSNNDGYGGLCLPPSFMEEMNAIVSAVRLLWKLYSRTIVAADVGASTVNTGSRKEKSPVEEKVLSITTAIQSQFLAMLPISSDGGSNQIGTQDHQGRYNATNAILCSAVGELGCILDPFDATRKSADNNKAPSSSVWTKAIFSYVLPRLERNSGEIIDVALLKVVGQLLLGPYLDNERMRRTELLAKFASAFFSSSDFSSVEASLCVSAAGRLSALLLVELMLRHMHSDSIDTNKDGGEERALVGSMAQALPLYLRRWEDKFPREGEKVLAALMGIVRRCKTGMPMAVNGAVLEVFDMTGGASNDASSKHSDDADPRVLLVRSLRVSIGELFEQPKKSKKDNLQSTSRQQSVVFEVVPELTQRLVLGLFGLLQYPTETVVLSLAKVCSRSTLRNETKDYAMDVMFSIRKTLPLQLYLTFLVNSSGIAKAFKDCKKKKMQKRSGGEELDSKVAKSIEHVFSFDIAIERLCSALVLCGGSMILPMLMPLLLSWLGDGATSKSTVADATVIVQRRAVFSIVACVSFDDSGNDGICFEALDPKLNDAVVATVVDSICLDGATQDDERIRFLSPVLALLTKRPLVLKTVLNKLLQRVSAQDGVRMGEQALQGVIQSLTLMLKHTRLGDVIRRSQFAAVLEEVAVAIEKAVANGPLDRVGGALRADVQLHLGRQVVTG